MGFLKDLEGSKEGVEVVKKWFEKNFLAPYNIEELSKKLQHKGDLRVFFPDESEIFIEVKFDKMGAKTGNLCFETSNGTKATGIMSTEADKVAYVVPSENGYKVYFFYLDQLKNYITTSSKAKLKRGGDKKKFSMYIVSIKDILEDKVCFLSEDISAL